MAPHGLDGQRLAPIGLVRIVGLTVVLEKSASHGLGQVV